MILARLMVSVWIFLFVTALLFFALETLPGDYASASAPRFTTWDQVESQRENMGLNDPAIERYFSWLWQSLQGEFGHSWYSGREIAPDLAERLGFTAMLAGLAALMSIPLGFIGGLVAVVRRDGVIDRLTSSVTLVAISMPEFLVAYALTTFFVVSLPIFPAHVVYTDEMTSLERIRVMILPAASLAIIAVAPVLRQTRASIINVLASPYIEQARLKGLGMWRIVLIHALPNAIAPIVNMTLLVIANFFVGAVIVEQIFSYPGIGNILISAVKFRDIPLVLALGLVFALIFISVNLLADLLSILFNPRLRYALVQSPPLLFTRRKLDPRNWLTRRRMGFATVLFVLGGIWWSLPENEDYFVSHSLDKQIQRDSRLSIGELQRTDDGSILLVRFDQFKPGASAKNPEFFSGTILVHPFRFYRKLAFEKNAVTSRIDFPGFKFQLIEDNGIALPVNRDRILPTENETLAVILSAGAAWSVSSEDEWTRVALPFTVMRRGRSATLNGVASFALRDSEVTGMRIQIAQEGLPGSQMIDWWGQAPLTWQPGPISAKRQIIEAYQTERATDFPLANWKDLERKAGGEQLTGFDNRYIRRHVSASGLLVDDTIYLRACPTRFGEHPFCAQLRHPVYSISKSLGAGVAMLRLAKKYGEGVFDERIADYLPMHARHDGWREVTFGDALNMATGIGDLIPKRVDYYVQTDNASRENLIWAARTVDEKVLEIAAYNNYPWGPGEVMRYKSSDTILLSIAMDRLLRAREGEHYGLIDMMETEVFQPLGVGSLPTLMIDDGPSRRGVPQYGWGMLPNLQQVAKLAHLVANEGEFNGQQILHREMSRRAVDHGYDRGLPTGSRYADGSEAHYAMSYWLAPFNDGTKCRLRVPQMTGFGGSYVSIMPNNTIGFRFADGSDSVDAVWDSSGIRNVSNRVRPFCG